MTKISAGKHNCQLSVYAKSEGFISFLKPQGRKMSLTHVWLLSSSELADCGETQCVALLDEYTNFQTELLKHVQNTRKKFPWWGALLSPPPSVSVPIRIKKNAQLAVMKSKCPVWNESRCVAPPTRCTY